MSVSAEFSDDSAAALDVAARNGGGLRQADLAAALSGGDVDRRAAAALSDLADGGFAWVDGQGGAPTYFLPSMWLDAQGKEEAPA